MHDIIAGKRNEILVGVTYGHGDRRELIGAGADEVDGFSVRADRVVPEIAVVCKPAVRLLDSKSPSLQNSKQIQVRYRRRAHN
jgi:hypothetical protein